MNVPAGDVNSHISTSVNSYNSNGQIRSESGISLDVGAAGVLFNLTVNDPQTDLPLANTPIELRQWDNNGENLLELVTDENGLLLAPLLLGQVNIQIPYEGNVAHFYSNINQADEIKYKDIASGGLCEISGRLIDRFNQPMPNTEFEVFTYSFWYGDRQVVTTDENGFYVFLMEAGNANLDAVDGLGWPDADWNQHIQVDTCRTDDASIPGVTWDIVGDSVYAGAGRVN